MCVCVLPLHNCYQLGQAKMMFIEGMVEKMTGWKHRNSWLRAAEISDILKDVQKRECSVVC